MPKDEREALSFLEPEEAAFFSHHFHPVSSHCNRTRIKKRLERRKSQFPGDMHIYVENPLEFAKTVLIELISELREFHKIVYATNQFILIHNNE
jgi:hypothetical protein